MSPRLKEAASPAILVTIEDGDLLRRVLDGSVSRAASATLAGELERRLANEHHRPALRRLLKHYATAAPEYVDEDVQAAARVYLGRYFRAT